MTSIAPSAIERSAYPTYGARPAGAGAPATAPAARLGEWYVRLFFLSTFFPYPGLPLGNANGLQLCQAMALASSAALAFRPPSRALRGMMTILTVLMFSNFINLIRYDPPQPDVMPKEALSYVLGVWAMWPATFLASRRRFRTALSLAAGAVLVHSAVGAYQMYAFTRNEFPLLWLYRNPSFMPMSSWAEAYATYMKRPCGLFPEPSAMGAALGPWLVLLAAEGVAPSPSLGLGPRARRLYLAAAASGFVLLGLSRSGSAVATVAALLLVVCLKLGPIVRRYGRGGIAAAAAVVAVALASAGYMVGAVGGDLDSRMDSSWGLRGRSIYEALTANIGSWAFLTGLGAGQAEPVIQRLMAGVPLPGGEAKVAVWSIAANYYMEHGLIGATVIVGLLVTMSRSVLRSSERALGAGAMLVWVVGITVTTSYLHIIPVWVFLGLLLEWDRVFPARAGIQRLPS